MNPPTPNWAMQATDKLEAHLRLAGYGITAPMRQTFIDVIRKHAPSVPAVDKALRLAAALPTGQNCPSENHAVVVAAMDALEGIAALAPHLSPAQAITGETSDGYHTFNELYDHRCTLFLALMKTTPALSWISTKHEDGSTWDGWFIAGMKLPTGDVTYHLPARMWSLACETGAAVLETGFHWDGHTAAQVVGRIQAWTAVAHPTVKQAEGVTDTERLDWLEAFYSETAFSGHSTAVLRDFTSAIAQHGYRKAIDTALRSTTQPGGTEG